MGELNSATTYKKRHSHLASLDARALVAHWNKQSGRIVVSLYPETKPARILPETVAMRSELAVLYRSLIICGQADIRKSVAKQISVKEKTLTRRRVAYKLSPAHQLGARPESNEK